MSVSRAMRPAFHYAPRANWLSDPNGLVWDTGEWHLFYQYNPEGEGWGHMSWGHAVSRDLVSWEELLTAIPEDDRHLIFSGSAVIDHANSAGFGSGAMVALYTGASQPGHKAVQAQCLASSLDHGRTFTKFAGNPVLDRGMADFRDPNVFWHEPSASWIMIVVLSAENRAVLYRSDDLRAWTELSVISGEGAQGEIWECPLLIELPVEGGGTRWLFKVDVLRGAPGSGAIYRTGTFDGRRFLPDDGWQVADWGSEFYAAIAWHEPRDDEERPLWIGWMGNHAYQGQLPDQGWRGAMSLPRRIWLRQQGGSYRLCQSVEPAICDAVPVTIESISGTTGSGRMALVTGGFVLRLGDRVGRSIVMESLGDQLTVIRTDPVSPFLDRRYQTTLPPQTAVEVWIDQGSLEILSADGLMSLTVQHRLEGPEFSRSLDMSERQVRPA